MILTGVDNFCGLRTCKSLIRSQEFLVSMAEYHGIDYSYLEQDNVELEDILMNYVKNSFSFQMSTDQKYFMTLAMYMLEEKESASIEDFYVPLSSFLLEDVMPLLLEKGFASKNMEYRLHVRQESPDEILVAVHFLGGELKEIDFTEEEILDLKWDGILSDIFADSIYATYHLVGIGVGVRNSNEYGFVLRLVDTEANLDQVFSDLMQELFGVVLGDDPEEDPEDNSIDDPVNLDADMDDFLDNLLS